MIIFNHAETLQYSTSFNYLGDIFHYGKTSTLRIKGRFQSDIANDASNISGDYFGIGYVDASGIWVPLGGSGFSGDGENILFNGGPILFNGENLTYPFSTGDAVSMSGNLSFDGGSAYISLIDNQDIFETNSSLHDIWQEQSNTRANFYDFQEIILNGVSVGSGRVKKMLFPESKDSRKATYETEIEIFKSGNLNDFSGKNFDIYSDSYRFVSNLDESFDFQTSPDGVLSYNRNLNFSLINPDLGDSEYIQSVKSFASGLLFKDPEFSAVTSRYPNFYENEGSRYFTESYNIFDGSFSFNERFQGPNSGENYRWTNVISLSFDSAGISVSEQGNIVGVRKPIYANAKIGFSEIERSSYSRANEVYQNYFSSPCTGNLFLTSKSINSNSAAGSISYGFQYSNNRFSNPCYQVTRQSSADIADDGVVTISEQGSIVGICGETGAEKLSNSINYFNSSVGGLISARAFETYNGLDFSCGCSGVPATNDLKRISENFTYSEFEGSLEYQVSFRSDCENLIDSCFYVKKEKSYGGSVHNVFLGLSPYSGEITQKLNTSSLATESQTITVSSKCSGKTIEDYISVASSQIDVPTVNPFYMEAASYQFNPEESTFIMGVNYNYTGYRSYANYNV